MSRPGPPPPPPPAAVVRFSLGLGGGGWRCSRWKTTGFVFNDDCGGGDDGAVDGDVEGDVDDDAFGVVVLLASRSATRRDTQLFCCSDMLRLSTKIAVDVRRWKCVAFDLVKQADGRRKSWKRSDTAAVNRRAVGVGEQGDAHDLWVAGGGLLVLSI